MAGFGIFGRFARRCGPWACLLAGLGPGILPAAAPSITWPAALYNPQPLAGDIVLPLPCGGAMAFRALPTPGRDAGYPVVGPFAGADGTPYLLLGKYEVSALQAQALAAEATGQACPPPQAALQVPALTHWWEAVELGDRASVWLANQAEDIPACDPGATPCLPRVDAVAAYVRLPTAAEWEYAARGGLSVPAAAFTAPRYPMPDGLSAHAWFAANSRGVLQPLGGLAASPLGLHDLYGNAAEWALEAGLAPLGAPPPFTAQALGGHTGSPEADLRADRRWGYPPFATDPAARAGLRLLASVPLFTSPEKVREGERRRQAAPVPAPAAVAPAPPTAPAPPPPPVKFYGHLRVSADAPGEVLVDGQVVGRVAPGQPFASQTIAVGERRVAVRAAGYQAPEQTHGFRTRQWVEANFRLTAVPEMIALPGGEFWMGSPDGEADRDPDEGPRHRVRIAPFAMGKTAVTFAQYDAFAQATGRAKPQDEGWGRGDRPVINVSWEDAVAYAAWLAQATGEKYRLPSEAEWEYAARAGTATPFWTGKCINTDQANYVGNHDYAGCGAKTGVYRQQTVPVGSLPANPWGLHEVHGNVWEWVHDQYHESYKGAPADGSVWVAGGSSARVVRGASWDNRPRNLRAAKRNRFEPDIRSNLLGFRLAKTLPASPEQPSGSTATAQDQAQSGPTPPTAGRSGQGPPAEAPPAPGVPTESLGARLKREVGGGGPVAILAGTRGLFAVSSDGKREQMLWPQPTAWVLVDARGRQIWFGAADKGSTEVLALDLDAVAPQPVVVAAGVPNDMLVAIVYRQGKTEESLHFSSGSLHGQLRLIVGGKAPVIDYEKGLYEMILEGATARRAPKKARLTIEGKAVLAALADRATGRHVAAKIPPPSRNRVENVDARRCEEASICGAAEAFGASPYLRVAVSHICGDACFVEYQLYDPRTAEFFDYSKTGRRSPRPLDQSPDLKDVWIAPDGSAFVMQGALYGFDGLKVVGGEKTGGGWLDTPAHLD